MSTSVSLSSANTAISTRQGLRLILVGVLALTMIVPIVALDALVSERAQRRQEALDAVAASWGAAQVIAGPALVVPYAVRRMETAANGTTTAVIEEHDLVILPRTLRIDARADVQMLHRGIFDVPVYKLGATLNAEFGPLPLAQHGIDPAAVQWDRTHVAIGISDVRAIARPSATWNGRATALLPGSGGFTDRPSGIHAFVAVDPHSDASSFACVLSLNGSVHAAFAPMAESTVVQLTSDSPSPAFDGTWLPTRREIGASGFGATWEVSFLGRDYPQSWKLPAAVPMPIEKSDFGVTIGTGIDHYRMTERSVKYAILFVLLTFGAIWLVEVLAGVRVHPIQYLMLGAGLCLFYLLELALSEHVGFPFAYALATAAIVAMITAYARAVFRATRLSIVLGVCVAALYGYLYVLLSNEDFALLVGSIALFAMLAIVMFLTRRIDWGQTGVGPRPISDTP